VPIPRIPSGQRPSRVQVFHSSPVVVEILFKGLAATWPLQGPSIKGRGSPRRGFSVMTIRRLLRRSFIALSLVSPMSCSFTSRYKNSSMYSRRKAWPSGEEETCRAFRRSSARCDEIAGQAVKQPGGSSCISSRSCAPKMSGFLPALAARRAWALNRPVR